MSEAGEAKYYENPALWERERYVENENELRRFTTSIQLIPHTVRSILDVGAGNGAFMSLLESENASVDLVGLERSETAISHSICKSEIRSGTAENLPFEDRSFDLVTALEVLEHLPYGVYEKALREIERVAREYIMISVPYREKRVNVQCPYCSCMFHKNYHMRSFDEAILSDLFRTFQSVKSVKVEVEGDYFLGPYIRRIYRTVFRNRTSSVFPRTTVCPQCGFSEANYSDAPSTKPDVGNLAKNLAKTIARRTLPKQRQALWIIVLYKRVY